MACRRRITSIPTTIEGFEKIYRQEYRRELDCCDFWIDWCKRENDYYGVNFYHGKRSAHVAGIPVALFPVPRWAQEYGDWERQRREDQSRRDVERLTAKFAHVNNAATFSSVKFLCPELDQIKVVTP